MFKFNFGNTKEDEPDGEEAQTQNVTWYDSRKIEVMPDMKDKFSSFINSKTITCTYDGDITLTCLSPSQVIEELKQQSETQFLDVVQADNDHSDLIPGKYEGGMKIWECTRDLVNYIVWDKSISLDKKKVLDLGCGTGILGIVALKKGASVTFQDYNQEVLRLITMPNVYLNFKSLDVFNQVEFYSGDWGSFFSLKSGNESQAEEPSSKKVKTVGDNEKFDFIFSSETIYNSENYGKLCKVIKGLLKKTGTCYLAAKKCYFGVGGNVQAFVEYLKKENVFNVGTCWTSKQGVSREIIKVTFI